MKYLIFDTETTGLPKRKDPASKGPNNWPHIVSISWVVLDSSTNQITKKKNYIIQPINWDIPQDSVNIHGITLHQAYAEGIQLKAALYDFLYEESDVIVAHNMDFDYNVLYNAFQWDLELPFPFENKPFICSMVLSKDICKIPYGTGLNYKYPKLSELYEHVVHKKPEPTRLHNSMYDVMILCEVIQNSEELRRKMDAVLGLISLSKNNEVQTNNSRILSLRLDNP